MATILHIEDDPHSLLLVRKLLQAAGHKVIESSSGIDGARLAQEHRPDLVLLDINIPDLDGYEVALLLRGRMPGVPILAITAEGDRATSLAVGCDGFLGKPIDARTFARTVDAFLGGHREAPAEPADDDDAPHSARATAASSTSGPSVTRSAPTARHPSPGYIRTSDSLGSARPLEHAAPDDTSIPSRSSAATSSCPSTPATVT